LSIIGMNGMKHILISNDDGIESLGLNTLYSAISSRYNVTVAAPDKERSASSHSLTIDRKPEFSKLKKNFYSINGTPADCIYLAFKEILKEKPDLVISGINHGANVAEDIFYSGTVSAAREAVMHGVPAIAVSVSDRHARFFGIAADFACKLADKLLTEEMLPQNTILNVNVPNLPSELIEGVEITIQGSRNTQMPSFRQQSNLGNSGTDVSAPVHLTDFAALSNNMISVTPLHTDLTSYNMINDLRAWNIKLSD